MVGRLSRKESVAGRALNPFHDCQLLGVFTCLHKPHISLPPGLESSLEKIKRSKGEVFEVEPAESEEFKQCCLLQILHRIHLPAFTLQEKRRGSDSLIFSITRIIRVGRVARQQLATCSSHHASDWCWEKKKCIWANNMMSSLGKTWK